MKNYNNVGQQDSKAYNNKLNNSGPKVDIKLQW